MNVQPEGGSWGRRGRCGWGQAEGAAGGGTALEHAASHVHVRALSQEEQMGAPSQAQAQHCKPLPREAIKR